MNFLPNRVWYIIYMFRFEKKNFVFETCYEHKMNEQMFEQIVCIFPPVCAVIACRLTRSIIACIKLQSVHRIKYNFFVCALVQTLLRYNWKHAHPWTQTHTNMFKYWHSIWLQTLKHFVLNLKEILKYLVQHIFWAPIIFDIFTENLST